jgi:hypothetical protein
MSAESAESACFDNLPVDVAWLVLREVLREYVHPLGGVSLPPYPTEYFICRRARDIATDPLSVMMINLSLTSKRVSRVLWSKCELCKNNATRKIHIWRFIAGAF